MSNRRQLMTRLIVGVGIGVVGTLVTQWTREAIARAQLKHMLLNDSSYSLRIDDVTIARLRAILPSLTQMHHKAVNECGSGPIESFMLTEAFNRRIQSWHAILQAVSMTNDSPGLGYVQWIANSKLATPEEVNDAKELSEELKGRRVRGN